MSSNASHSNQEITVNAYAAQEAGEPLTPFTYTLPALNAHDVDIHVEYCGICHSDLSMLNNEWGVSQFPLVAGHEIVGTVAAVGDKVDDLNIGQRVGLGWHSDYCFTCDSCETHDHNLCTAAQPTIVGRHGGFADRVRAHAGSVVPLPEGMDASRAGPLFCGGVTVFNPLVQYDIQAGDKVAVIGIGGLGHLAIQFLRAWGCEVTAFTSNPNKKDEALSMGAHHVVSSTDKASLKRVARTFDLILSTVNVDLQWHYFIDALKPKGRLHFVGATLEPINLSVMSLLSSQRSLSASPVGSPETIQTMLDFAMKHNIMPTIDRFAFDDVNVALRHLSDGKARYRVVLERTITA